MKLSTIEASATLVGTVVGAGILGIPFAIAKIGFPLGLVMLLVLGAVMTLRHLMLAEVTLRTPHVHQAPGYAGIYLGAVFKKISFVTLVLGALGALLAYLIGAGEVLAAIFSGASFGWSIIFFLVGSLIIYAGLNVVKHSELVMTGFTLLVTLAIGIFAWRELNMSNLIFWRPSSWVLPYGVILFAYSGLVAIPEMREQLKTREKLLSHSVVLAGVVVFIIYLIFSFLVLGVTGATTTEVATLGLGQKVGPAMILVGNLLAFFTMGTSFLTVGLGLKQMFVFDYGWPQTGAWLFAVLVPLLIFFLGARDFIKIIGIIGGFLVSLQSIIIVMTYWRARRLGMRRPEFSLGPLSIIGSLLILIFVIGAIFTFIPFNSWQR